MPHGRFRLVFAFLLIASLLASLVPTPLHAQTPEWLEPRGLGVLDFVGQVPEEHLRGSILVFTEAGVVQYLSGRRNGDQVTVEVSMTPYRSPQFTEIWCLGRRPLFDEWPVAVPPSQMRVFSAGADVTNQIGSMWYFPAEQERPIRGSLETSGPVERYAENRSAPVTRNADGSINVPANMGCKFFTQSTLSDVTAEFVFDYPQQVEIEPLGSETWAFRSYVGPGDAGRLSSLSSQLSSRFGNRHDKFPLNIPSEADFIWLNYPPTPVSPYASSTSTLDHNIRLPSSGTYRLIGEGDSKSVDHLVSMGLPLSAQWIDSGLSGGDFLNRTTRIVQVSAPEYFVPPGVPYDPCMMNGGCSGDLLDRIYNTSAEMTLHYYRVRRLQSSNLINVPLRQVGRSYSASAAAWPSMATAESTALPQQAKYGASSKVDATVNTDMHVSAYLPTALVWTPPATFPDDAPQEGCPCGWFDEYYRLLDIVPGP